MNKFEERIVSNSLEKGLNGSPLKMNKLQPLAENVGATQLLQAVRLTNFMFLVSIFKIIYNILWMFQCLKHYCMF